MVVFRIRELFFFSLIQNLVRSPSPVFSGSNQDITALLDLMLVTVRFVSLSGNRARKKEIIGLLFVSLYHFFEKIYIKRGVRKILVI